MEFHDLFLKTVTEVNNRVSYDSEIQQMLNKYHRRSLIFKVRNDAIYVFYISKEGVIFNINPSQLPNDMYLEMDLGRARKLVYRHTIGLLDIPFVIYRNITLNDIDFTKKLFGVK